MSLEKPPSNENAQNPKLIGKGVEAWIKEVQRTRELETGDTIKVRGLRALSSIFTHTYSGEATIIGITGKGTPSRIVSKTFASTVSEPTPEVYFTLECRNDDGEKRVITAKEVDLRRSLIVLDQ